ncbi:MAG: ParB/RepB/Spo0J family partition protein [Rhizobacter sp.]
MNAPEPLAAIERPAIDGAQYLPLNLCEAVSFNPRKRFDPAKLADLAVSVEKFGVMQPVLARPKANAKRGGVLYEIVAGERRLRACKIVAEKRNESDIAVIPAIVRNLTDFEARELATTENLQRDDLHPIEEAEGYEGLLLHPVTGGEFTPKRLQGYSVDELAARLGKSRGYVFGRLKLLALIQPAREAFFNGKLSASVALMVARMPAKVQETALPRLLDGWGGEPYTARSASEFLHKNYMLALRNAVFDIGHVGLVPKAGSCHACPKRTGANPDLFHDVKGDDICTDPACFDIKSKAHADQVLEKARARGQAVVTGAAVKKIMPHGEQSLVVTGHLNLDKPAEDLTGSRKPLRDLLGDDFKAGMLVQGDHQDQPMNVASKDDVRAALKAKGLLQSPVKSATPGKKVTAEDIKKDRKNRVSDLMHERAPAHLWKHLLASGQEGINSYGYVRSILAIDSGLYGYELAGILDLAGLHKKGTGRLSHEELHTLLIEQPEAMLANILFVCVMCDHLQHDARPDALQEFAKELDWPAAQLLQDIEAEVNSAIRDEIETLKAPLGKPVAKKSPAAKTKSTPPVPAAAQGAKPGQKTPETALAEALAKEAAPAAAKKASQKDNTAKLSASKATPKKTSAEAKQAGQKDKAAAPPTAAPRLSETAAWPFPKGGT